LTARDILTIDDMLGGEEETAPMVCPFCHDGGTKYATYIEFDFAMHLYEVHHDMRWKWCLDEQSPNHNWPYRILEAISEGRKLGEELDEDSKRKLDQEYLDEKPQATAYEDIGGGSVRPWSRLVHPFTFKPVVSVDEFFKKDNDSKPYSALHDHSLEESPCYPILGVRFTEKYTVYYCEICQPKFSNGNKVSNIHLSGIEHHCKYHDADTHKAAILQRPESRCENHLEVNIIREPV
jgi:hypothetical protein